ncbi:Apl2 protein [Martiniozyma asiatica (nom. inval.)]|nr:Apl2 protein [Martiniozyma asiatica]
MTSKILQKKFRRFFNLPQKGENYEFRSGLVSKYAEERKDTIQRVIAAMTTGKDVSGLFPLVVQNIATHDIQQKKLVYLYLINYAKSHPELVILATNTFVVDCQDPNPLIRALAIRTMGCIRVDKMVDYMALPLKKALDDVNPYVRKTAVICVVKLFDLNPQLCIDNGFLEKLVTMLDDSKMVVANAIAALGEIMKMKNDHSLFKIDSYVLSKMLSTLDECSEWGRVSILKAFAEFDAQDVVVVREIIDRVSPLLQHENPAVVLNSIKVLINQIPKIPQEERKQLFKRMSSPLCSLLSTAPEIQYVALRNIRILLELYPNILDKDLRAFFIKYTDPLYLKIEKIEIMVRVVTENTSMLLLSELREYAMDVEPDVVSRAIEAMGQLAIKVESASKKCIDIIYELFINRGEYVLDDTITTIQQLMRKYPTQYLSTVLSIITSNSPDVSLTSLNSTDAQSSYVWLVGQYAKDMPYLNAKLTEMSDSFVECEPPVQVAILNTLVKLSLNNTETSKANLQKVLDLATKEVENPDVRDKAFIYWRLLSSNNKLQKDTILTPLPTLQSTIPTFTPELLETLKKEIGMLGSVYYRPGSTFGEGKDWKMGVVKGKELDELNQLAKMEILEGVGEDLLGLSDDEEEISKSSTVDQTNGKWDVLTNGNGNEGETGAGVLDELNDLFSGMGTTTTNAQPASNHSDLLNLF